MADKQFSIRISQAGADQAATSIRAAADATRDLAKASTVSVGDGSQLRSQAEAAKAATAAAKEYAGSQEEVKKTTDEVLEHLQKQADGMIEISKKYNEQMAEAAKKVAEIRKEDSEKIEGWEGRIKSVGSVIEQLGAAFGKSDPEIAKSTEFWGVYAEQAAEAVGVVAKGFQKGGIAGAAIAAATSYVELLGKAWLGEKVMQAEAAEKLKDDMAKINDQIADHRHAIGAAEGAKFIEQLDEETEAVQRQNTTLEENQRLLDERKKAASSIKASEIEKKITEIKNDDSISPQDKIRQEAEQRESLARLRAQDSLDGINSRTSHAKTKVTEADNSLKEANKQAAEVTDMIADFEHQTDRKDIRELPVRERDRLEDMQGKLPGLKERLKRIREQQALAEKARADAIHQWELAKQDADVQGKAVVEVYQNQKAGREIETNHRLAESETDGGGGKPPATKVPDRHAGNGGKGADGSPSSRQASTGGRDQHRGLAAGDSSAAKSGRIENLANRLKETGSKSHHSDGLERLLAVVEENLKASEAGARRSKAFETRLQRVENILKYSRGRH